MSKEQPQQEALPYAIRISDFFVDFFGALIPGIVFTAIFLTILINLALIILSICLNNLSTFEMQKLSIIERILRVNDLSNLFKQFYFLLFMIFIVSSYIFGFIFQRRGARLPDEKSFIRVYDPREGQSVHEIVFIEGNRVNKLLSYFIEKLNNNKYISKKLSKILLKLKVKESMKNTIQALHWPYKDLIKFLGNRVPHLTKMITWGKEKPPSRREINAIKEAIQFNFPDHYGPIARQEAHARLVSSIWFICRTFNRLSGTVFVILVLGLYTKLYTSLSRYDQIFYITNVVINGMIFIVALWIKIIIEKTFHFQRVRELLLILNSAYLSRKIDPRFGREYWPEDL